MKRRYSIRAAGVAALMLALSSASEAQQTSEPIRGSVEGVVVDSATGTPLAGVQVQTPPEPGAVTTNPQSPGRTATTNLEGHFELENIPAGRTLVTLEKAGYLRETLPFTVVPGRTVASGVVELSRQGVISGRVLNANGDPVSSMSVSLYTYRLTLGVPRLVLSGSGGTDDLGEFRLSGLRPDRYLVGFSPIPKREDLVVVGPRTPAMDPRFRTSPNDPANRGNVPFLYPGVQDASKAEWIELNEGETRLRDVVAGPNRLGVVRLHFQTPGSDLPEDVDVAIVETHINDSISFGPYRVSWAPGMGADHLHLDTVETVRSYWFPMIGGFEVGTHWKSRDGEEIHVARRFEFTGSDTDIFIDLTKPEGKLDIRVSLEESDGATTPMAGIVPLLCDADTEACLSPLYMRATGQDGVLHVRSISKGAYKLISLENLPANTYIARADFKERDALVSGVTVTSDEATLDITVRRGLGRVEGIVHNSQGHAVANALVGFGPDAPWDSSALDSFRRTTHSDREGRFRFFGVYPGSYRFYAKTTDDFPSLETSADLARRGIPLRVEENGKSSIELELLPPR